MLEYLNLAIFRVGKLQYFFINYNTSVFFELESSIKMLVGDNPAEI